MKAFLEHVAQDIIDKYGYDLSHVVVVFPNKRASLFLNEYLARIADKPIWSPSYITISELFQKHSELMIGDQIKLICDLYKSFINCTGIDETLDHFYGWGQVLLSDFDDIDKNMADAEKVLANLADIHEFDDISYLSDEQKTVLKTFFSNFSEDHNSELKKRFISLWSNFYSIYKDYNERLTSQGIAYEGALYRQVVSDEMANFEYTTYLFVGFNMLQKVEQQLFSKLKNEGKAKFYWDFDKYFMNTNNNEAGYYIKQYLSDYPNEFGNTDTDIYDNMSNNKDITYISTMTENIQARYIIDWLSQNNRIDAGKKTAIVLCDEQLLPTIIHSLPPEVNNVNITIGYPLSRLPIFTFVNMLIQLQTIGCVKNTDKYRLHYVNAVLRHPYAKYVSYKYLDVILRLSTNKNYFPDKSFLSCGDDGLSLLFKTVEGTSVSDYNINLSQWLMDVLRIIGINANDEYNPLFGEAVFRMYTLIHRLSTLISAGDLIVDLVTFQRLLTQLIQSTSIPFHGEPAIGIQIMGVLETRNLDFDNVLVLSCNEGNMPKGINDTSFIPYSIRKAFELTTIDNKVSIYSYYFHSIMQRASNVTLTYNSSTEDGHTGEMSRFMLQMLVESDYNIRRKSLHVGQLPLTQVPKEITKDDAVMQVLNSFVKLSPTAINRYLRCPLQFYYNVVAGIKESDNTDDDTVDNRVFGNIFHRSAELIYRELIKKRNSLITKEDIDLFLKNKRLVEMFVDQAFKEKLFKSDNPKFQPTYNGIQIINRRVIIGYLHKLLEIDKKLAPINIKALEEKVNLDFKFNTSIGGRNIKIEGIIDRLDSINIDGMDYIRVIDYKTGKKATSAINSVEEIFNSEKITDKHKDYFLQTILYSIIVCNSCKWNSDNVPVGPALMFIQHTGNNDYDPILQINKNKITDVSIYLQEFMKYLSQLLGEIFDPNTPFKPTKDNKTCEYCPYNRLCMA